MEKSLYTGLMWPGACAGCGSSLAAHLGDHPRCANVACDLYLVSVGGPEAAERIAAERRRSTASRIAGVLRDTEPDIHGMDGGDLGGGDPWAWSYGPYEDGTSPRR